MNLWHGHSIGELYMKHGAVSLGYDDMVAQDTKHVLELKSRACDKRQEEAGLTLILVDREYADLGVAMAVNIKD
jgi:hypothetical protein